MYPHPHNIAPPPAARAASLQALSYTGFSESSPAGILAFARVSEPNFKLSSCFLAACLLLFCLLNGLCLGGSLSAAHAQQMACLRFRNGMQIRKRIIATLYLKDFTVCQVLFSALHVCSVIRSSQQHFCQDHLGFSQMRT